MDCAQALAVAAAALMLVGEPLEAPAALAHEAFIIAASDAKALLHDTHCSAAALWSGHSATAAHVELAVQFEGGGVPDARIHAAFRHPI